MIKRIFTILLVLTGTFFSARGMEKKPNNFRSVSKVADQKIQDAHNQMIHAVHSGNLEMLKKAVEQGATINCRFRKDSLLHIAIRYGHNDIVEYLVDRGANVNAVNTMLENRPLDEAASHGHLKIVIKLFKHGADINTIDQQEDTPLHGAAFNGYGDIVEWLIEHGAAFDTQNKFNDTPLDRAASGFRVFLRHRHPNAFASNKFLDIIALLIIHGAHLSQKAKTDLLNSPIQAELIKSILTDNVEKAESILTNWAEEKRLAGSLQLDQSNQLNQAFSLAIALGQLEIVHTLWNNFKNHFRIEALEKALIAAATTGQFDFFTVLYNDIKKFHIPGFSQILEKALYWATLKRREDIVDFILEYAFIRGDAGDLDVQRTGQHITNLLRRTNLTEQDKEILTRIRQSLINITLIRQTAPGATALHSLASIFGQRPTLPLELTAPILSFILHHHKGR